MSKERASEVTIVLTLKDRSEFTRRWMAYMHEQRCPHPILIADGGADTEIEAWLRDPTHYPNLRYEYIRYPFDSGWPAFYAKQQDVCSRVQTDYLLFADNDDFYIVDEIQTMVDYLDQHSDYVGCRGEIAYFSLLDADGKTVNATSADGYRAAIHESRSIDGNQFVDRVAAYFDGLVRFSHQVNWYAVYRSDAMVHSLDAVYRYEFADVVLNEALLLTTLLRQGKIKVLDSLYYLRQMGSSQAEASLVAEHNVLELFLLNDAFHDFGKFLREEWVIVDENDRVRIVKSLGNYIGDLCSKSLHYHTPGLRERMMTAGRSAIGRYRMPAAAAYWTVSRFSHLLRGTGRMRATRLAPIEKFVLGLPK
jgi:glycosyltransferase domain-containing protein